MTNLCNCCVKPLVHSSALFVAPITPVKHAQYHLCKECHERLQSTFPDVFYIYFVYDSGVYLTPADDEGRVERWFIPAPATSAIVEWIRRQ